MEQNTSLPESSRRDIPNSIVPIFYSIHRRALMPQSMRSFTEERVLAGLFSAALQAADIVHHFALIQARYQVRLVRIFEFVLQSVEHDPTQFLDVVLLPSLTRIPTEAARQIRRPDRMFVRRLID